MSTELSKTENVIIPNYELFTNSNEIMSVEGYGIIWTVTKTLSEFVKDSKNDNTLKMSVIESKLNNHRTKKIYPFLEGENLKPNQTKEIHLYCDYEGEREMFMEIALDILNNRAYYMKVFGSVCAYATQNDEKDFNVSIDELMKYGYEKNEKRKAYDYADKKRFSQTLIAISKLQFMFIFGDEKGIKQQKIFHLFTITERNGRNQKGNNILNNVNISLFSGFGNSENRLKEFQQPAFSLPIKSLKYNVKDEKGYLLGFVISRKLEYKIRNGVDVLNIDFQELMPFISTSKTISKPQIRQRLEAKLKELEKFFAFTFTKTENGNIYSFKSLFYNVQTKKEETQSIDNKKVKKKKV